MQLLIDSIVYYVRFIFLFFRNGFKIKTALFSPRKPSHKAILAKILKRLNYNITSNPRSKFQIAVNWEDATFRSPNPVLQSLPDGSIVINKLCNDISKNFLGRNFEEVFGYPILVNPFEYKGKCVKKNNFNASKVDTKIVECPVDKIEEGYVYLNLIDTQIENNLVVDYRIPVIRNTIPLLYLKKKQLSTRFLNDAVEIEIHNPLEYLTENEIADTLKLCRKIGLDYGELDILRDNNDGRIYIIDANNTPWGPPTDLTKPENKRALEILTTTFEKEYLQ